MEHSVKYNFFMSQLKFIENLKETDKVKIDVVYHTGLKTSCILRVCKNRDLSQVCTVLQKIRNSNTVVVHDFVYENQNTYMLEENVDGSTVEELLREAEVFSEKRTAAIIIEVCKALEQLHKENPPVVHNDINPSNIKIRDDGSIKLFDFDISRIYKQEQSKNTMLFGTEEYASPEHFGYGQSEPRTDIYCLGVTMHKMLTGQVLTNQHRITYNGPLRSIVEKCLEFNPKERYNSAIDLRKDLEKFLQRKKGILHTTLRVLCAGVVAYGLIFALGRLKLQNNRNVTGEITQQPNNAKALPTNTQQGITEDSYGNGTTIPIETAPTIDVSKPYVDTLATLPLNADETVITKSGIVYYIQDNKLYSIENGETKQLFDGEIDYYEEISKPDMLARLKENPNYWSGLDDEGFIGQEGILYFDKLTLSNLGYVEENDTVYVSGCTNIDFAFRLKVWNHMIYTVSNMNIPIEMIACGTLGGTIDCEEDIEFQLNYTNRTLAWYSPYNRPLCELDLVSGNRIFYEYSPYELNSAFNPHSEYLYLAGTRYEICDGKIGKYDIAGGTWLPVELADNIMQEATAFCTYNDQIYYATSNGIWYLEDSGTNRFKSVNLLYWSDFEMKDGAPIGEIYQLLFDENGNILFIDNTQNRFRQAYIF